MKSNYFFPRREAVGSSSLNSFYVATAADMTFEPFIEFLAALGVALGIGCASPMLASRMDCFLRKTIC